jgi:hypothetical protein
MNEAAKHRHCKFFTNSQFTALQTTQRVTTDNITVVKTTETLGFSSIFLRKWLLRQAFEQFSSKDEGVGHAPRVGSAYMCMDKYTD